MTTENFEKNFKRKRLLSLIIGSGYSFVGGCEYVVILPTAWNYLQSLGVTEEYWLGFTLSIYSFAAAISGVIGGRLADLYVNHAKCILIISIALRAAGNFQYILGISVWNILSARLICGIGTAAGTTLLAEICRTTTVDERTRYLSICNGGFEFGILIGPAIQLLLSHFNFSIFSLQINPLNAAGLFMGVFWTLYLFATLFMYHNLAEDFRILEKQKEKGTGSGFLNSTNGQAFESRNAEFIRSVSPEPEFVQESSSGRATYQQYKDEFLTDYFVVLISMMFIQLFLVCGADTIVPVITQDYFGYGVFENSLIYMGGGIEAICMFLGLAYIAPFIRDTTLLIIGWVLILFSVMWLMIVIPIFEQGNATHVVYFISGIMIIYLSNPILLIATSGLVSKVLSNETQGLGQGIMRLSLYMGLIYGPTWAGATVKSPYLFLGVSLAIIIINGVMFTFSFKHLRAVEIVLEAAKAKQLGYDKLESGLNGKDVDTTASRE